MLTERYDIKQGESIEFGPYTFHVVEMAGNHIKTIEITKIDKGSPVLVED